ncbi:MAG: PQQ-like beta-propeller repeat protein [Candidatus Hydrogenedens sp.]|nr:PQQ-like beta-propeller repeat protein [Candidatus Hydrogenedens sp.]
MLRNKSHHFIKKPFLFQLSAIAAVVSALFILIVSTLMIANYIQILALDPVDQPELLALREEYAHSSEMDPEMIARIRALDFLSRKAYFTSQTHLITGGKLLLGAAIVFLVSMRLAGRWNPQAPGPPQVSLSKGHWSRQSLLRELVILAGLVLMIVAALAALFTPLNLPTAEELAAELAEDGGEAGETVATSEEDIVFPDWEALQKQWPSFRGPGGYGRARTEKAPLQWDGETGKNIRWKTALEAPGFNSPVVWGDSLFFSSATDTERKIHCYDTEEGELKWELQLPAFPGTPDTPPRVSDDTGHAAPTMVVHYPFVYAIFANGDLVCCDFSGEVVWGKNLGVPENHYGHSSSLIAWEELLYIQFDDKKNPRLTALNAQTGNVVWETKRKTISWASPSIILHENRPQLILASEKDVDSYNLSNGALYWSVECLDGEVAPSPAWTKAHVFVGQDYSIATAIKLSEEGGTPAGEAVWEWDDSLTDIASPVGAQDYFIMATSRGEIVCLDALTGEDHWLEDYDDGFHASPISVGDLVYALETNGDMHIFKASSDYELVARNALGDKASATPAFVNNRIYLRTHAYLWCVEEGS